MIVNRLLKWTVILICMEIDLHDGKMVIHQC